MNLVATRKPFAKTVAPVRLLQMDVAARDPRATETGWVFGTFAFDAAAPGASGWEKMVPVGLMSGDRSEAPPDRQDTAVRIAHQRGRARIRPEPSWAGLAG